MDSQIDLQQPIADGISSVNFFNGRMLTARDLTGEQATNREVTRRLGRAVGAGVAYGFELFQPKPQDNQAPIVSVAPGLAVNGQGQTLWLREQVNVALVRKASASATGMIFAECTPLQSGTYVAGAGVYLLTVAPAETRAGRAVTSGLSTDVASCNTDAVVSAVQFRLIQIDPPITATELQEPNLKYLRNVIAYKCFGVADTQSFVIDPFGSELTEFGLLDSLRPDRLTNCDVPLGVLYWTLEDGIKFIDMWSVRRGLFAPAISDSWNAVNCEKRSRTTEAMIWQFADHLKDLGPTRAELESLSATQHFNYLPPVGFLPVSRLSFSGVIVDNFFRGFPHREPEFIDGKQLRALLKDAVHHEPIDLSQGELVWLYKSWENEQVFVGSQSVQPFVVFASAHMPYLGPARFDVARWDLSNYARCENC